MNIAALVIRGAVFVVVTRCLEVEEAYEAVE